MTDKDLIAHLRVPNEQWGNEPHALVAREHVCMASADRMEALIAELDSCRQEVYRLTSYITSYIAGMATGRNIGQAGAFPPFGPHVMGEVSTERSVIAALQQAVNELRAALIAAGEQVDRYRDGVAYAASRLADIEKALFAGDTEYHELMRRALGREIRTAYDWQRRIMNEIDMRAPHAIPFDPDKKGRP